MEIIRHGRELATDCVQSEKESAIGHGPENKAEQPRTYDDFSTNGNDPLNTVSQSRGAPQHGAHAALLDLKEVGSHYSFSPSFGHPALHITHHVQNAVVAIQSDRYRIIEVWCSVQAPLSLVPWCPTAPVVVFPAATLRIRRLLVSAM